MPPVIRPPLPVDALSANARIVDASFLESVVVTTSGAGGNNNNNNKKVSSNKETVRRLAKIVQVLQTDDSIDPARTDEWPGLSSLANLLVSSNNSSSSKQQQQQPLLFLASPHKEVRLYSVLCCLELLGIFAPDLPGHWTTCQLLTIFTQTLQQVSNLSHCYTVTDRHYVQYTRILDLLAEVKIGIILVELVVDSSSMNHHAQISNNSSNKSKNNKRRIQNDDIEDSDDDENDDANSNDDNDDDENNDNDDISSSTPLEVLAEFFQTLLGCVRREHPGQIRDQVVNALAACLEEFDCSARLDTSSSSSHLHADTSFHSGGGGGGSPTSINIPIRIIDEILLCLGAGPTVTVNVMTAVPAPPLPPPPPEEESSSKKKRKKQQTAAPPAAAAPAPPPKAQLRTKLEPNPQYLVAAALLQKTANKTATPIAALLNTLLNSSDHHSMTAADQAMADVSRVSSIVSDPEMAFSDSHDDVWSIIAQVHRVAPAVLTTVIGTVGNALASPEFHRRYASVQLLGQLFARKKPSSSSSMVIEYRSIFMQWLGRQSDIDVHVRKTLVSALLPILTEISSSRGVFGGTNNNIDNKNTSLHKAVQCLQQLVCTDPDVQVRLQGIQEICEYAHKKGTTALSNTTTTSTSISVWLAPLLRSVGSRLSAKNKSERKDAVTGLTRVYWKQYMMEHVLRDVAVIQTVDDDDDDDDERKIVSPESLDVVLRVLNEKCHLHRQRAARRPARQSSILLLPTTTPASKKKRQRLSQGNNNDNGDSNDDAADHHGFFDEDDGDDAEDALYAWIPKSLFSAVSYSDQMDTEMRSRIVQLVDEVLLGSDQFQHKTLTPLARAVGLTVILHALREDEEENLLLGSNAAAGAAPSVGSTLSSGNNHSIRSAPFLWMLRLMEQRAALQKLLTAYIEARAKVREHKQGTEDALAADAKAMEILMGVAQMTAPVVGQGISQQSQVLQAFHEARDKHIFRILATIAQANHSHAARARALEELPKRTHPLGDAVSTWVKNLVRRCAMGYFMNAEIVHYSVLLARESFLENDISACATLLVSTKTAATIFPALGGTEKTFHALTDLFSACRAASDPKTKKEIKEAGIITALSSILSLAAPLPSANARGVTVQHDDSLTNDNFQAQLFQLCTRDGTPEQARNAVYTLARTVSSSGGGASQRAHQDMMSDLLKALTCPTRLTLLRGGQDAAIISLLSALSAYSDCQPQAAGADRMKKATRFALATILLGRGDDDDEDDDESEGEDVTKAGPRKKNAKSASKQKHTSPNASSSLLDDEDLSIACRRLCAAINFLVCHVRASILHGRFNGSGTQDPFSCIPRDHAKQIFDLLTQMLRDKGLPPSNRDRRLCKSRQDRAALRQCSAIHLFRLCDSRLKLENTLLSMKQWHQFSTSLLDEEKVVRRAVLEEFSFFLKGSGVYGGTAASSPALRFVAFLAFCTDGDHGHDRDPANGFAANVGKSLATVHSAALECVVKLREACDATYTKCRLMGPQAEKRFESYFKMLLMPEYMVPFAFHLLCHRRETITAVAPTAFADADEESGSDEEDPVAAGVESKNRLVRKRLKTFFEPLVSSLGDSADNISFLLSMTSLVRNYSAIDVSEGSMVTDSLRLDSSVGSRKDSERRVAASHRPKLLERSITLLSETAREVLISLVKKDVNLSTYPGSIVMPAKLFKLLQKQPKRKPATSPTSKTRSKRQGAASKTKGPQGMDIEVITSPKSGQTTPTPAIKTQSQKHRSSIKKRPMQEAASKKTPGSSPTTRVHFSPDLQLPTRSKTTVLGEDAASNFGDMSPIDKFSPSAAPQQGRNRAFAASASVATLGTTPPSILPTGTQSTAQTDLTDTESVDSARPCDHIVESEVKLSLSSELGHSMSDGDEDHDGTAPEMQSSSVSRSSRTKKRKPDQPLDEKERDEGDPRLGTVPEQIKFKDKFRTKARRKKEPVAFAADSQSSIENQENAATKIVAASKKKASQGTTRASEAKASGRRRLRPRLA